MSDHDLSVVIPALDAEAALPATLAALEPARGSGLLREVLVVDGGSRDATTRIGQAAGAKVMDLASPNRGRQLAAGAEAAAGWGLLFLHADSRLAAGWEAAVSNFLSDPAMANRAGYFALALDDPSPQARRIERLANWRARRLGLPYGDQGLLIGREFYESLGGFAPIPLMEDVELARRIGRRRLVGLPGQAVTSAARYRRDGWWRRPLRNLSLLALYFLGLPPGWLRRLYG
jgi:rSAM/selenodomain-associated transferase 2